MANRTTAGSIDEYIAGFPPEHRKLLAQMRALIRASAPDAQETISYAIPTFDRNGRHLVHFAGFANHIGFYPTGRGVAAFKEELEPYAGGKGSVRFPIGTPLPVDLIRRIVESRVEDTERFRGARAPRTSGSVAIENVNHPGSSTLVDVSMYDAVREAILQVLPRRSPGMTLADMADQVRPLLPEALFPEGAKAGWYTKAVQLDLEAKGLIERERVTPLRLHRVG